MINSSIYKHNIIIFLFPELNAKYFKKPDKHNVIQYWLFHPHQPETNIPFTALKTYFRKDGGRRMWVSYNHGDLKIVPFMPDLSHGQLCQEYNDFVSKWPKLKRNCISDQYKEDIELRWRR